MASEGVRAKERAAGLLRAPLKLQCWECEAVAFASQEPTGRSVKRPGPPPHIEGPLWLAGEMTAGHQAALLPHGYPAATRGLHGAPQRTRGPRLRSEDPLLRTGGVRSTSLSNVNLPAGGSGNKRATPLRCVRECLRCSRIGNRPAKAARAPAIVRAYTQPREHLVFAPAGDQPRSVVPPRLCG